MAQLRNAGAKFTTSHFLEIANEIDANGFQLPEDTEDQDAGVVPIIGGQLEAPDETREWAEGDTFVFTCAQSNTLLNTDFFEALEAYCAARDAELHISQFTYNKRAYGKQSVKPGTADTDDSLWFDPRIEPYVSDSSLQITDDLVWCGELNIIPTRQFPLTTLKSYTRQSSGIVPHAKMQMESVPTMKGDPAKLLYTTGTVTQRNYIQKVAGQVAEFHHVFGALVVEVDREQGIWWARQLNADKDGGFYDLNTYWTKDGPETEGTFDWHGVEVPLAKEYPVQAITHGDIHFEKRDDSVLETVFKPGGVVDQLRPKEQYFHDSIDFTARNHHNIKDPHFLHQQYVQGRDRVIDEFKEVTDWLVDDAYRPWAQHYIIVSNHDQAIEHWLRNPDGQRDPANARFWHEINAYMYEQRDQGIKPHPFEYIMQTFLHSTVEGARFRIVREDESVKICGDIEAGLHGHLGPNGARGNPKNLRTVGKANTAHTHSAGIVDGVYTAGVYGQLDMGYNKGLSSWSHSLIVTYQNSKRAILAIKGGRAWRDQ